MILNKFSNINVFTLRQIKKTCFPMATHTYNTTFNEYILQWQHTQWNTWNPRKDIDLLLLTPLNLLVCLNPYLLQAHINGRYHKRFHKMLSSLIQIKIPTFHWMPDLWLIKKYRQGILLLSIEIKFLTQHPKKLLSSELVSFI